MSGKFKAVTYQSRLGSVNVSINNKIFAIDFKEKEQKIRTGTLIKKKIYLSSYIRKFRWDRVQSHI
jgi:hypothetical protein